MKSNELKKAENFCYFTERLQLPQAGPTPHCVFGAGVLLVHYHCQLLLLLFAENKPDSDHILIYETKCRQRCMLLKVSTLAELHSILSRDN